MNLEDDLRRERDYWQGVALYLADCHAATAEHDGNLSSTSKSRRGRLGLICERAAQAIKGGFMDVRIRNKESVAERCADAARALRGE